MDDGCPLVEIAPGMLTCPQCGRLLRSKSDPSRVKRTCNEPDGYAGVPTVSTCGKLLLALQPGDRIKALAEVTGIEALAKRLGCGCKSRRLRLNRAVDAFALKWFAKQPEPNQ